MSKNNKIKIKDIKRLSDSELKEVEELVNSKLNELEINDDKVTSRTQKIFIGVLIGATTALTAAAVIKCKQAGVEVTKETIEKAFLFGSTTGLTSACLCSVISNTPSKQKYKNLVEQREELIKEKNKRRNNYKMETDAKSDLGRLADALTKGVPTDEKKDAIIDFTIKNLIENGADPKLLEIPVIRNIFAYELNLPVSEPRQSRAFSYDPANREIRKDGTFDIATCIRDSKYSFPIKINFDRYIIKYCEEQTDEQFIEIKCPDNVPWYLKEYPTIYLDKNGNISKLIKFVREPRLGIQIAVTLYPKKEKKFGLKKINNKGEKNE